MGEDARKPTADPDGCAQWIEADAPASIGHGVVHLWRAWLDPRPFAGPETLGLLERVLSDDERTRANRLRFDHLQRRFILARWQLRKLLGAYLGCAPEAVEFAYGAHGKPRLRDVPEGGSGLHFNVSHSGDVALFAFAHDLELGVDVEQLSDLRNAEGIAERHFSPREYAHYRSLAGGDRMPAFFECWTRKEAFIKAMGTGISFGLDRFEVEFGPERPVRLLSIHEDEVIASAWQMAHLEPSAGFVGAVAAPAGFDLELFSIGELRFPAVGDAAEPPLGPRE